jgi:O-antigen/teichoic acid export membrane protein
LIWLNFEDAIYTFNFQQDYMAARWVFFYLGLTRIIDMGTGVNSQIIGTSTFWRFEFISGLILLALSLLLNYQLTRYLGILGPAISNLVAFTIYNLIRYLFLWKRFKMQPFTIKTVYTILLALAAYYISWILFHSNQGFLWMVLRSSLFILIFVTGMFALRLSPDVQPVLITLKKKLRLGS